MDVVLNYYDPFNFPVKKFEEIFDVIKDGTTLIITGERGASILYSNVDNSSFINDLIKGNKIIVDANLDDPLYNKYLSPCGDLSSSYTITGYFINGVTGVMLPNEFKIKK